MGRLEIRELPEYVLQEIANAARQNGRTMEQEAADLLVSAVGPPPPDEESLLAEIRAGREQLKGVRFTDAELRAARRQGLP